MGIFGQNLWPFVSVNVTKGKLSLYADSQPSQVSISKMLGESWMEEEFVKSG